MMVIEGEAMFNGESAAADHFVLFKNDGDQIRITASEDSIVLVMSGAPIDEPLVQYGPFLMNTKDEIIQAIREVNEGKFGHLD